MFSAGSRGGVAYSKHLAVFMAKARVGLHESVVMERRGDASRGVGLYCRDALDEGTSVAVVPNDMIISTRTLKAHGAKYLLRDGASELDVDTGQPSSSTAPPRYSIGLVGSLLGSARDMEWVELAWRLAIERCSSHSFWWGWLDGLPSASDFAAMRQANGSALRARYPHLEGEWCEWQGKISDEVQRWYARLEERLMMPPRAMFDWAVRVLLTRSSTLIQPVEGEGSEGGEGGFTQQLGILPIIDACNTSDTVLIDDYDAALDAFIEASVNSQQHSAQSGEYSMERLERTFLQLKSRENNFFFPTSSASTKMLSSAAASNVALNNAAVEVAPSWADLPKWYQELIVAGSMEKEASQRIGMTTSTLSEPLNASGLFPAFVLTLSRPLRAGEEILIPYETPRSLALVEDNSARDCAMRVWTRYGIVV